MNTMHVWHLYWELGKKMSKQENGCKSRGRREECDGIKSDHVIWQLTYSRVEQLGLTHDGGNKPTSHTDFSLQLLPTQPTQPPPSMSRQSGLGCRPIKQTIRYSASAWWGEGGSLHPTTPTPPRHAMYLYELSKQKQQTKTYKPMSSAFPICW